MQEQGGGKERLGKFAETQRKKNTAAKASNVTVRKKNEFLSSRVQPIRKKTCVRPITGILSVAMSLESSAPAW